MSSTYCAPATEHGSGKKPSAIDAAKAVKTIAPLHVQEVVNNENAATVVH